ncbi:hypothetical protein BTZ20_2844 [Rhodococcus sp. MTM3W5.2]|nr:hypothetical protein BTZ20_2844 [Rhodococcus sp. MTM3W5.2]
MDHSGHRFPDRITEQIGYNLRDPRVDCADRVAEYVPDSDKVGTIERIYTQSDCGIAT